MKIAIVVPGGLHPSGEEQVVPSWLALFERLAQSHDIHAFALKHLDTPQSYALGGFTVHDLGRPSSRFGLTRSVQERALHRALAEHGPFDVIHGFYADPAGQLAARAGRRLDNGRKAVREACTLASKVHVCTTFMGALAAQHKVTATVIPLTSVTSQAAAIKWPPPPRSSDTFRIVQVASLSRVKNQRLLIDAMPIVRESIDAHLDLVGEDTLGGELQNHAAQLGLTAHVTFHGFLPQPRVQQVLSQADLYVQSSMHEAAGVSVLEAAAAGVPTAGTLAGHVADWSPTRAVALGDAIPESFADAIITLHADPDRRRSMAALARTFSIAHDATWVAAQFERLYGSLTT